MRINSSSSGANPQPSCNHGHCHRWRKQRGGVIYTRVLWIQWLRYTIRLRPRGRNNEFRSLPPPPLFVYSLNQIYSSFLCTKFTYHNIIFARIEYTYYILFFFLIFRLTNNNNLCDQNVNFKRKFHAVFFCFFFFLYTNRIYNAGPFEPCKGRRK